MLMREADLAPITQLVQSLINVKAPDPSKVVKYAPKYKLVFSLFLQNASAEASLPEVDLRPYLASHIYPTLTMLKGIHNFSIETQTQYYAPLDVDVEKGADGGVIDESQLGAFVNAAEWNLGRPGPQ
jgi:phosphatidylinositol glycan class S